MNPALHHRDVLNTADGRDDQGRSMSTAEKPKTKDPMKPILLSLVTFSFTFSAAMTGETGPASVAPAGGVHAAGVAPAAAADKAGSWEPVQMDLKAEAAAQYQTLVVQIGNRRWFQWDFVSKYAADSQALIHAKDRDPLDVVLRRTRALLADVKARGPRDDLSAAEAGLQAIEAKAQGLPAAEIPAVDVPAGRAWVAFAPPPPSGPRYDLFLELCAVRRRIALANPLLDFDQILFIRRAEPSFGHMVTYPGRGGDRKGEGLFVLGEAFGAKPTLKDLLAGAAKDDAQRSKLDTSRPITVSAFDLSYDARTILFDALGKRSSLFRIAVDGSGLTRLTDGAHKDCDPCLLPDGRVVFLSDQRGGYGRCHGWGAPVISTLHVINADGSGRRCLSFHDTNEWNPSVGHDGKIIYTRWDYVDREPDIAHHMWECFPDGRNPRSLHGNYPVITPNDRRPGNFRFGTRPFGEWSCRAVPDRPALFVATAGGHHAAPQFGSLVLINLQQEDDGAQSQIRRVTPDAPFCEAEGTRPYNIEYGYPWPLSDRFFLCAYNADNYGHCLEDPAKISNQFPWNRSVIGVKHGLYLVDVFGNKELLYRDPSVYSLYPVPLRARPRPPVIASPLPAAKSGEDSGPPVEATMAVMNVYESDFSWSVDTKIKTLRLIQLLPKSTHANNRPRIGIADQNNARAVLGTVPVEEDGSAHFYVPSGKPFYFQALDERGMAVQSMRSLTYAQPGEQATCLGCHESKRHAPSAGPSPAALRRPPSKIRPDVDGSNPFNYVRLVQPVLDRHCVACHAEKKAMDLSGARIEPNPDPRKRALDGFTRSYANLAPKYAFWFDSVLGCAVRPHGGARTIAGKFGAMASPLLALLDKGHHGVKLPPEDLHRLTLWLDCNSDFYGAYHSIDKQLMGEIVKPDLE